MSSRRERYYDPATGTHFERTIEDVEPVLEENQAFRNNGTNGFSRERTFRKIGSIPMIMYNDAFKQGINPFDGSKEAQAWIMKLLADNPKLRTVDAVDSGKSRRGLVIK